MIRILLALLWLCSAAQAQFAVGKLGNTTGFSAPPVAVSGPTTTYTFASPIGVDPGSNPTVTVSRNLGAANSARSVLVYVANDTVRASPTVTIGGVAATNVLSYSDPGSTSARGDWYTAAVPLGSGTQNIVLTYTGSPFGPVDVHVWPILNLPSLTPTNTTTFAAGAGVTIANGTIASGNGHLAFCGFVGGSGVTSYWQSSKPSSNTNQRFDADSTSGGLSSSSADWTMNTSSLTAYFQSTGTSGNGSVSCVDFAANATYSPPAPPCTPGSCTYGTNIFNCSAGFSTNSATCGANTPALTTGTQPFIIAGGQASGSNPNVTGTTVVIIPTGSNHGGILLNRYTPIDIRAFQTTFQIVPNDNNFAFVIQNSVNNGGPGSNANGPNFAAGATCEAAFSQSAAVPTSPVPPDQVFGLDFDQVMPPQLDWLTGTGTAFSFSTTQIYRPDTTPVNSTTPPGQNPCMFTKAETDIAPVNYSPVINVNRISTSPVALNSPASTPGTSTGHTFQLTVTYDGSTLGVTMFDVTASGTCTPVTSGTCFSTSWTGVNFPQWIGSNLGWIGIGGSTNASASSAVPLILNNWTWNAPP